LLSQQSLTWLQLSFRGGMGSYGVNSNKAAVFRSH